MSRTGQKLNPDGDYRPWDVQNVSDVSIDVTNVLELWHIMCLVDCFYKARVYSRRKIERCIYDVMLYNFLFIFLPAVSRF